MTPAARYQAAIEILDRILDGEAAEKALTSWARRSRFAGSKDRAAIRDHVFDALRRKRSAAALGGAMTGRGLILGLLRGGAGPVEEVFTGLGHAPAPLSDAESAVGSPPQGAAALDLPDWMEDVFRRSLAEQAEAVAATLQSRAPVMLRVNPRKADRPTAVRALAADGIHAEFADIAPRALIVTEGARKIANSAAYRDGLVELQDGASQAVVAALDLPQGGRILDYCAGGGGKTLAMADSVEAQFFAHDANYARMKDLADRASRAGVKVQVLRPDQTIPNIDFVLCDVPCSGSGSWRRAPDGKWQLSQEKLRELCQIQAQILNKAASLLQGGGQLAYATCSVFECENDQQIDRFLQTHPDWQETKRTRWLPGPEGDGFFLSCLKFNRK